MRCLSTSSLVCLALLLVLIFQLYHYHSLPGNELGLPSSQMQQRQPSWSRKATDTRLPAHQASASVTPASGVAAPAAMQIPPLLYGTAWKKERTASLVELAVRTGFRGIDTACQPKHYHEPGVGTALTKLISDGVVAREDIYLQTKFTPLSGQDPNNIPYDKSAPLRTQVQQSFQASLRNLGTPYLDCLLLHSPLPTLEQTLEVWREFEALQRSGAVHRLGISNCYDLGVLEGLHAQAQVKPTVLQNRFYRDSGYDVALRSFCRQHNITYESFWTLTANPTIINSGPVTGIARRLHKTPSQVFFAFVRSQGITFLTGTSSQQHMEEDLEVPSIKLEEEEVKEIESLLK